MKNYAWVVQEMFDKMNKPTLLEKLKGIWGYLWGKPLCLKLNEIWVVNHDGTLCCPTTLVGQAEGYIHHKKCQGQPVEKVIIGFEATVDRDSSTINFSRLHNATPLTLFGVVLK